MNHHSSIENKIFFNKYKPDKKLGEGSFGQIYSSHNIVTGEKYALKLENKNSSQNLLEQEAYILCYLKGEGIPSIKSYGISGDHNVLVMEWLGKSWEDLFQKSGRKLSIKTVCMLGIQMIARLKYVHDKHILHRDIKPDNFIMGIEQNSHKVYIIDFGLSKKYRSSRTLQHIKYSENKKMTGTARYASRHALKGCEQGRRDDMEAVGYVWMYFLRGSLPWQGWKVNNKEDRYQKIYEKKVSTSAEELCIGFPKELCEFIQYTRCLKYEAEPDYEYLKNLLETVLTSSRFKFDYVYDWTHIPCINKNNNEDIRTSFNAPRNNWSNDEHIDEKEKNINDPNEFGHKAKERWQTITDSFNIVNNKNNNENTKNDNCFNSNIPTQPNYRQIKHVKYKFLNSLNHQTEENSKNTLNISNNNPNWNKNNANPWILSTITKDSFLNETPNNPEKVYPKNESKEEVKKEDNCVTF